MKKRLTSAQLKEYSEYLYSQGWTTQQIGELLHPERAWHGYQIWKLGGSKAGEAMSSQQLSKAAYQVPVRKADLKEQDGDTSKRKGRGPGKKPPKQITTVQLDPDQLEALQRVAEREERTVSAVIRLAIREYLEKYHEQGV